LLGFLTDTQGTWGSPATELRKGRAGRPAPGPACVMTRWLALLLVLLSLAAAPQAVRFVSREGRFAVDAPGELQTSTHSNETPMGSVEEHIFRWTRPGLEWVVNYSDVPGVATAVDGLLFLEVRHGFRKTTGNPVSHDRAETFAGCPGRRFEFRIQPTRTRATRSGVARILLVDARLYVLTVTWDDRLVCGTSSSSARSRLREEGWTPTATRPWTRRRRASPGSSPRARRARAPRWSSSSMMGTSRRPRSTARPCS
jgi:hypothetical protein